STGQTLSLFSVSPRSVSLSLFLPTATWSLSLSGTSGMTLLERCQDGRRRAKLRISRTITGRLVHAFISFVVHEHAHKHGQDSIRFWQGWKKSEEDRTTADAAKKKNRKERRSVR